MEAIITMIAGVGGANFPTAVVITAAKGMDTVEMLAMTGGTSKESCLKIVKAQGHQRITGEGRREGRIMATGADARLMISPAMDTRLIHQTIQ